MKNENELSLQERYALKSICFGCGPSNTQGLRIRSFAGNDGKVIAHWKPELHHQAFPGVLNGGIVGSLLDCHANWTAAWWLMNQATLPEPPCTVTAEYSIKLRRPTPVDTTLELSASVVEEKSRGDASGIPNGVTVVATLTANGKVCATCTGVFVAVKSDHPAYHRW